MEKPDPVLGDLQYYNLPHASNLFTFVGGPFNSIGNLYICNALLISTQVRFMLARPASVLS